SPLRTMRTAVNEHGTGTANPFTAIVIKRNGFLALVDKLFIQHIKHLQKRHIGRNAVNLMRLESSFRFPVFLTPDFQGQLHISAHLYLRCAKLIFSDVRCSLCSSYPASPLDSQAATYEKFSSSRGASPSAV